MSSTSSLEQRYPDAVAATRRFFAQFFPKFTESEEDERDALVFEFAPKRTIGIDADFLATNDENDIFDKLTGWNIANLARTLEAGVRLNITVDGPESEEFHVT